MLHSASRKGVLSINSADTSSLTSSTTVSKKTQSRSHKTKATVKEYEKAGKAC